MKPFKYITNDILLYIPSFLIPSIIAILSVPIFTRYLDPDAWADFILVVNAVDFLVLLSVSWLSSSAIRFYEQSIKKKKNHTYLSTVLVSALLAILTFLGLILLSSYIFHGLIENEGLLAFLLIGIWIFVAQAFVTVIGSVFRAKRKVVLYSGLITWRSVSRLAFGFIFLSMLMWGAKGLLIGYALGLTIGLFVFGYSLFDQPLQINQFERPLAVSMLIYGLPLAGGDISYWFLRISDRYILSFFRNSYEVGIYSVGYDLGDRTMMMLISLLAISAGPIVMQTWERRGQKATAEFLSQLMRLYLILCIPAVVAISILRVHLINVLADQAYFIGNKIIPLVVGSVFLFGFQRWFALVIAIYKKTYLIMFGILGGSVTNILLNLIFIPDYGYQAAAINNLIGYFVFAALTILFSRKLMTWKFPFVSLGRSLLASTIMAFVIFLILNLSLPNWLILAISISGGTVIYGVTLLVSGEVKRSEISNLFVMTGLKND